MIRRRGIPPRPPALDSAASGVHALVKTGEREHGRTACARDAADGNAATTGEKPEPVTMLPRPSGLPRFVRTCRGALAFPRRPAICRSARHRW